MKQRFYPIKSLEKPLEKLLKGMCTAKVGDQVEFPSNDDNGQKVFHKVGKNNYGSLFVVINVCNGYRINVMKRTDKVDSFIINNQMTFWVTRDSGDRPKYLTFRSYAQVSKSNGKMSVFTWDDGEETFNDNSSQKGDKGDYQFASEPDLY